MNSVALFAETPRAGKLGHRFLLPPSLAATESEIAVYLRIITSDVVIGQNFMAMGRSVPQYNNNGVVRLGREIIVIAGIDTQRLSEQSEADLRSLLQKHLYSLEDLVLAGIDWTELGQAGVIIRRQEMEAWLDEYQALSLVFTPWQRGPRSRADTSTAVSPTVSTDSDQTKSYAKVLLVVSSLVSFVIGLFAGPHLPSVTSSGNVPEQTVKGPVANEMASSLSPSSGNEAVSEKAQSEEREPETHYVQANLSALLQNVIEKREVDTLAAILESLPSGIHLPREDSDGIIKFCSSLLESENSNDYFESVSQIANSIDGQTPKLFGSNAILKPDGTIDELKNRLKSKFDDFTFIDRDLYKDIQEASGEEQFAAAKKYLKQAPRKTMNLVVAQWLKWAESPIRATVHMTKLSPTGSFTIRFSANGGEIGKAVDSQKIGPILSPLDIDLTGLGITPQKLPSMVAITVRFDQSVMLSNDFDGQFEIRTQSTGSIPVALKGRTFPHHRLQVSVQLTQIDSAPELPEWQPERTP